MAAKVGAYFARATRLLCPVCGRKPIFPRARTIRRVADWFVPFDGCPRCGYAFEREPGYFLVAMWAVNSGFASLLGVGVYFGLAVILVLPPEIVLPATVGSILIFNVLFARHAKAFFIAVDHLLDPHEKEGGDDRGNQRVSPPPSSPDPGERLGGSAPTEWTRPPTEPCETRASMR